MFQWNREMKARKNLKRLRNESILANPQRERERATDRD